MTHEHIDPSTRQRWSHDDDQCKAPHNCELPKPASIASDAKPQPEQSSTSTSSTAATAASILP